MYCTWLLLLNQVSCRLGHLEGAILLPESRHAPPGLAYVVLGMELTYSPSH